MKKLVFLVALVAATACGKNKDIKVKIISSDVSNMTQSFTISQDGKNQSFDEGIDEEIILHKGKVQCTLTTSTNQVVMTPAHVQIFQNGALVHETVCYANSTETSEFKLKN